MNKCVMTVQRVMGGDEAFSLVVDLTEDEYEAFNSVLNDISSGTNEWHFFVEKVDPAAEGALEKAITGLSHKLVNDLLMPMGNIALMKRVTE